MEQWKENILQSLIQRKLREQTPYELIIKTCTKYLDQNTYSSTQSLKHQVLIKETEKKILSQTHWYFLISSSELASEIEAKIDATEKKLSEIYRQSAEYTELIISLIDGNQNLSKELKQAEKLLADAKFYSENIEKNLNEANEFNRMLEIFKSHLIAEKESLTQSLDTLLKSNQELSLTNQEMIGRMMDLKQDQIVKMNELHELEQAIKLKENLLPTFEIIEEKEPEVFKFSSTKSLKPPRKRLFFFQGHEVEGTTLIYNSSGTNLITSGSESVLKVWDSYSGLEKNSFKGFLQSILCVCCSPFDDIVIGGSSNSVAYAWNSVTTKLKHCLTGHCGKVTGLGFLRSNLEAVSASEDKTLKIWSIEKGYCISTIGTPSLIYSLAVSDDDQLFVSGHKDGGVRMFCKGSSKSIYCVDVQRSPISSVSLSKCGNYVAVTTRDNNIVVQDLRMQQQVSKLVHKKFRCAAVKTSNSFSPNSRYFTSGSYTGDIITWNVNDGSVESLIYDWHTKPVIATLWNPNDSSVASIDSAGNIGIWG